ncbi:hypothetical protein E3N88_07074 [Mikania micrantha]|uniref:Uncharacterized protein n=1 Tax=Mikania micrantha TaxID=192012 RepID=A0A5N6PQJ4_9ASTR|nr:hypothetical protein E3N88_07074 [Mikania micrantha]
MEEFNISNIYARELYQNQQYLIEERRRAYFDHYKGLTPTHQYEHVDLSSPPPMPKGMCHQRYPPSMPSQWLPMDFHDNPPPRIPERGEGSGQANQYDPYRANGNSKATTGMEYMADTSGEAFPLSKGAS